MRVGVGVREGGGAERGLGVVEDGLASIRRGRVGVRERRRRSLEETGEGERG